MSTFVSLTSSSYEPYALASGGQPQVFKNSAAREEDEDEAAAVTVWAMSLTWRVEGSSMRSLTKVSAMPPVAKIPHRIAYGAMSETGIYLYSPAVTY